MIPVGVGAGQDGRAADPLDLGARFVLAERADIAPAEHEHRLATQEVVPRLAEAPADLRLRARLVQLLQELERRDMAGAVDQRRHVGGIEPVDVVVLGHCLARRHGEGRRQRLEVIVPLLSHLEVEDGAAIGLIVVRIPVLAVEVLRDVEELLPGLGRDRHVVALLRLERRLMLGIVEHVAAVIEHLAVGVVEHAVARVPPGVQGLERGRHGIVGPLRMLAALHELLDREHVVAGDQVAVEEGADDDRVVEAGALTQIEHHLGVEVGDRGERDLQRAAGKLLPDRAETVDRPRDPASRPGIEGENRDRGPLEGLLAGPEQGAQLLPRGLDDGAVLHDEVDGPVVVPLDVAVLRLCVHCGQRGQRHTDRDQTGS